METRIHTATKLYNYIKNARQMENLAAQIKSKEEELELINGIDQVYKKLGIPDECFNTAERYNKTSVELIDLQLKKNALEREVLLFERKILLED